MQQRHYHERPKVLDRFQMAYPQVVVSWLLHIDVVHDLDYLPESGLAWRISFSNNPQHYPESGLPLLRVQMLHQESEEVLRVET